jgi:hypothetical protein
MSPKMRLKMMRNPKRMLRKKIRKSHFLIKMVNQLNARHRSFSKSQITTFVCPMKGTSILKLLKLSHSHHQPLNLYLECTFSVLV